jgi:hypothetical protein
LIGVRFMGGWLQAKEIFRQPGAVRSYRTLAEKDILPIHGRKRMQIYHKQVY